MSTGNFEKISEHPLRDAETLFSSHIQEGGKAMLYLVYSCGVPDRNGDVEEDLVALIDREESPKFDKDYGMYCFPFSVVTYRGQNSQTIRDFAVSRAKETFFGGRKLPFGEIDDFDLYRIGDNRGDSTLFLPVSVHINIEPDHHYLDQSNKFAALRIGDIIWDSSVNVAELLRQEDRRVGRKQSADELAIAENYIEIFTEQVADPAHA